MRLSGRTRLWKLLELWKTTRRVFHEFQQCSTALTTKFSASPKIQKPKQITRIKKEERKELSISLFFYIGVSGTILRTVFKQCYWRWLHSHKGPGTEGLNFSKLYPWAKCREIRSSRCWLKVWPLQTDHSRPWQGFTVLLTRFQFTQGESTR